MRILQLLAVHKFGSVHVSSPVPDSKFQTKDGQGDQKQCLEVFCLQQRGKLADAWFKKVRINVAKY